MTSGRLVLVWLLTLGAVFASEDQLKKLGKEERCYEELGCLLLDKQWYHPWRRPVNLWPQDPEVINTTFFVHIPSMTAQEREEGLVVEGKEHLAPPLHLLDSSRPTKVIIHNHREDANTPWVKKLTADLLSYTSANVVRVNWSGGADVPYLQAVANVRLVGLEVAHFLNNLVAAYSLQPASIHLIGYALGAHAAAYSAEKVEGAGRITGLTPSSQYFEKMPPVVRLDESDAVFVDIIHTDINGEGVYERCGTVDFYPNGGGEQPGCGQGMKGGSCSKQRAVDLYTASVACPDCFLAHKCSDEYRYAYGMCYGCSDFNKNCNYLGELADQYTSQGKSQVSFQLITSDSEPYTVHTYRVWFSLAYPWEAEDWVEGQVSITLQGRLGTLATFLPNGPVRMEHGQARGWVLGLPEDLGAVESMVVLWQATGASCGHFSSSCNTALYIQTVKVTPIDYVPDSVMDSHTRLLCDGELNTEVKSGFSATLTPKDWCKEWIR